MVVVFEKFLTEIIGFFYCKKYEKKIFTYCELLAPPTHRINIRDFMYEYI